MSLIEPTEARDARLLDTLARLTQIGMNLACALERDVLEGGAPVDDAMALRFSRIARAVRQSVALEHRLAEDRRLDDGSAARFKAAWEGSRRTFQGFKRKVDIASHVAGVIEERLDEDSDERAEAYERLDAFAEPTELDALYLDRPAGDIVVEIMHALGLVPADLTDFDVAAWETAVRERYAVLDPPELRGVASAREQHPPDG